MASRLQLHCYKKAHRLRGEKAHGRSLLMDSDGGAKITEINIKLSAESEIKSPNLNRRIGGIGESAESPGHLDNS